MINIREFSAIDFPVSRFSYTPIDKFAREGEPSLFFDFSIWTDEYRSRTVCILRSPTWSRIVIAKVSCTVLVVKILLLFSSPVTWYAFWHSSGLRITWFRDSFVESSCQRVTSSRADIWICIVNFYSFQPVFTSRLFTFAIPVDCCWLGLDSKKRNGKSTTNYRVVQRRLRFLRFFGNRRSLL